MLAYYLLRYITFHRSLLLLLNTMFDTLWFYVQVIFSHKQLVSWRDYQSSSKQLVTDFPDSLESERSKFQTRSEMSNLQSYQELDRSMSSVAPSKVWKCYSSSAEYFDSIDNSGSVFQDANTNFDNDREGLADCDSLEQHCSDVGDLV